MKDTNGKEIVMVAMTAADCHYIASLLDQQISGDKPEDIPNWQQKEEELCRTLAQRLRNCELVARIGDGTA